MSHEYSVTQAWKVTLMSQMNGSISPVDDNMIGENDIFLCESDLVAYIIIVLSCINQIRNTSENKSFRIRLEKNAQLSPL